MLRRLITSLGIAALVLGFFAASAGAQSGQCFYYNNVIDCASPTPTSGLGEAFADQGGPSADTIPTPAPTADATTADAPQLAFTGSDSKVFAYVGSGLLAAGALALGARRRIAKD